MADRDPVALAATPARRLLLADVNAGLIADDDDGAPMLHLGEDGKARVAEAIWAMERAGWVRQPEDSVDWELTDTGRAILEART